MKNNKVARVFLDDYGIMHTFGYLPTGEVNFNEERATEKTKVNWNNSVDVSHLELYRSEDGYPLPAGKKEGEGLTIKRDEHGGIVSKEGFAVDETLQEVYALAEAKKAE